MVAARQSSASRAAQNVRAPSAKAAALHSPPTAPQRTSFGADTRAQLDTKQTCPLCVEELDDTDRDFFPCPCGYQVCLFCYGQVKEKCNSQCPGCRRVYGEPVDAHLLKQQAAQRAAVSSTSQGHTTRAAAAAAAAALVPKQRGHDAAGSMRAGDDTPLPSGATWAAHAATRQPPPVHAPPAAPRVPPPVDQSAWPSLSDSSATTMRRPARQEAPHLPNLGQLAEAGSDSDTSHSRSYSPSSANLTPLDSHSSSSQDLIHDQAAAAAGACAASGLQPLPASTGRTVASGRSLLAAGKAPPGFGGVAPSAAAIAPVASPACPTHQDPSVAGPPLGKYQPIQPPLHHASQRQESASGYYSVWSGLPGIELNLSQAFGGVHVLGAYPCSPPPGSYQSGTGNCFGARPPPPGFGPTPYALPAANYGAQGMYQYQMFGGLPNGGQFGMAQPSGLAM